LTHFRFHFWRWCLTTFPHGETLRAIFVPAQSWRSLEGEPTVLVFVIPVRLQFDECVRAPPPATARPAQRAELEGARVMAATD
jgi:hypothetical protein